MARAPASGSSSSSRSRSSSSTLICRRLLPCTCLTAVSVALVAALLLSWDWGTSTSSLSPDAAGSSRGKRGGGGGGGEGRGMVVERKCERWTKSGMCVDSVLDLYDEVYRPLWPGNVDLLIRSYVSDRVFLLSLLFQSLRLMWPRGIGRIVLVLDEGDESMDDLIPPWVEVFYEKNYLGLPGKLLQQWSYAWADNYTTAPFIAIVDDDIIFNLKVTPPLLFNISEGAPFVIGSKDQGYLRDASNFFLGPRSYFANFMVSLPFLFPRDSLPRFRQQVEAAHPAGKDEAPSGLSRFDLIFKWWSDHSKSKYKDQIAHTTFGNYLWHHERSKVRFALEWTDHPPIPRTAVHVPYSERFKSLGGVPRQNLLNVTFLRTAAGFVREALCNSFPPGELDHCEGISTSQRQIWRYAWDRENWPGIRKKRPGATMVFDNHLKQLHCIYEEAVKDKSLLEGENVVHVRTKCLRA